MNKLIHFIYNVQPRILLLIFIPLGILANYFTNWVYLTCLGIILSIVFGIRFFKDKRWLKSADMYVRIADRKGQKSRWRIALEVAAFVGFGLALNFIPSYLLPPFPQEFALSILIPIVFISYGDYFIKFVNSIKSFEDGIQVPGRDRQLITWIEIQEFELGDKVQIKSDLGQVEYDIDERDKSYMLAIISKWKSINT